MAVIVWNSLTRYAAICVLANRGEASAAVIRENQGTEEEADDTWGVYFKKTYDGDYWPPDSEAVRVGEIANPVPLLIRQRLNNDYEIEGPDAISFRSQNGGATPDDWEVPT